MQQRTPMGRGSTQYSQHHQQRKAIERYQEANTLENYRLVPPLTPATEVPPKFGFDDAFKRKRSKSQGSSDSEGIDLSGTKQVAASRATMHSSYNRLYQSGLHPAPAGWTYDNSGRTENKFGTSRWTHNSSISQQSGHTQDEENTPKLQSQLGTELKPMSLQQAQGTGQRTLYTHMQSQKPSQLHEHFHRNPESAGNNFPAEFKVKESKQSLTDLLSTEDNRRLNPQHMHDHLSHQLKQQRPKNHDLKGIDDEVFAMQDRRERDEKQNSISIKASHASDIQEDFWSREDAVQKAAKESKHSLNAGNAGSLNSMQSESYLVYMDKDKQQSYGDKSYGNSSRKYTDMDRHKKQESYKSQFGQRYIQNNADLHRQADEMSYRKEQKLQNNFGRESTDQKAEMRRVNQQLQNRRMRQQQQESDQYPDSGTYKVGDGMGSLSASYFTSQGRQDEINRALVMQDDEDDTYHMSDMRKRIGRDQHYRENEKDILNPNANFDPRQFDTIHPQKLKQMERSQNMSDVRRSVQGNMFDNFDLNYQQRKEEDERAIQYMYQQNLEYRQGLQHLKNDTAPIFGGSVMSMSKTYNNNKVDQFSGQNFGHMYTGVTQEELKGQQEKEKETLPYLFYETQSKYISLKKFSEDLFQLQDFQNLKGSCYNGGNEEFANSNIRNWFNCLLSHEKAIVVTIFDKKLVDLIKKMQMLYLEHSHGTFQFDQKPKLHGPSSNKEKMVDYNLHFVRDTFRPHYDIHGPMPAEESLKKLRKNAEDHLISSIRLIRISNEVEAITLSNDYFENQDFMYQMMEKIDQNWLNGELKLEKAHVEEIEKCSVLIDNATVKNIKEQQNAANRKKKTESQVDHWVMNKRDGQTRISSSFSETTSVNHHRSTYTSVGLRTNPSHRDNKEDKEVVEDKSQRTLGQMLCHIIEKAINVQYMDFKNKLKPDQQKFFFKRIEPGEMQQQAQFIWKDLQLAKFFMDQPQQQKDRFWTRIIEQQVCIVQKIKETNLYKRDKAEFEEIKEESEEEEPKLMNSKLAKLNNYNKLDEETSSEDADEHERQWDKKQQNRMLQGHKYGTKYLKDEDDLEQGKYNYKPIPTEEPVLKTYGKGVSALDQMSDRTDTDQSVDKPLAERKQTKDIPRRETVLQKYNDPKSAFQRTDKTNDSGSNYENDTFDPIPSQEQRNMSYNQSDEDEMDDDFNLPRNHEQNQPVMPKDMKIFQDLLQRKQNKQEVVQEPEPVPVPKKKKRKNRKKNKEAEEEKSLSVKQELPSWKKNDKRCCVEDLFQKCLDHFKKMSSALKQVKIDETEYQSALEQHYILIRFISTYEGLPTTIKQGYIENQITQMNLKELTIMRIHMMIQSLMNAEYQMHLDKQLEDVGKEEKKSKNKKKKANKQEVLEEDDKDAEDKQQKKKNRNKKKKKKSKETNEERKQEDTQIESMYMDEIAERRRESSPTQIKSNSNKKEPQRIPSPNCRNQINSLSRRNIPQTPDSKEEIRMRNLENQNRLECLQKTGLYGAKSEGDSNQMSISDDSTKLRNQKALLEQLKAVDGNMVAREQQMLGIQFNDMKFTAELNSQNTGSLGSSIEGGFMQEEKKRSELEEEANEKLKEVLGHHVTMREQKRGLLDNKIHDEKYQEIPPVTGFGAPKVYKPLTQEKFKRAHGLEDEDLNKMRSMGLDLPKPAFRSPDHMLQSTKNHHNSYFGSRGLGGYDSESEMNAQSKGELFKEVQNDIEGSGEFQNWLGPQVVAHGQQLSKEFTTGMRRRDQEEIERERYLIEHPEARQGQIAETQRLIEDLEDLNANLVKIPNYERKGFQMTDLLNQKKESKRNEAQADEILDVNEDGETKKNKRKKKKRKNKNKDKAEAEEEVTTIQDEQNTLISQVGQAMDEDWQRQLDDCITKEKRDDSDRSESPVKVEIGDDDAYFDDNFMENMPDPDADKNKSDQPLNLNQMLPPNLQLVNQGSRVDNRIESAEVDDAIELDQIECSFAPDSKEINTDVPKIDIEQCKKSHNEAIEKEKTVKPGKKTKQDKKREAKQAQKEKKKEKQKQQEAEKARQKELQQKRKEEAKLDEPDSDPIEQSVQEFESTQRQKELELPRLSELSNKQELPSHMKIASDSSLKQRDIKRFKRDKSYEEAQPPKRGSSRGTSMASKASSGGKKIDDPDLDALEEFFPKEVTKVQEATKSSINASLNNSKKNSPESSTQKDAATVAEKPSQIDANALKQALEQEQKKMRGQSSEPGRRADLGPQNKKQDRRSPTPTERRSEDLAPPPVPVLSIPEHEVKQERQASRNAKKKESKTKQKKAMKDANSPQPNVIEILRPDPAFKTQSQPVKKKDKPPKAKKKKESEAVKEEPKKDHMTAERLMEQPQLQKCNLASQLGQFQPQLPDINQMPQQINNMPQFVQPPKRQAIPQDRLQEILKSGSSSPDQFQMPPPNNNMQMTFEYVRMTYNMQNMNQQEQNQETNNMGQMRQMQMPNMNVNQPPLMAMNMMMNPAQQFQGIPMYQQQYIQMPANMTPQQVQGMLQNQFEQNFKMNPMMPQFPMNFPQQLPFQQPQFDIQQQLFMQQQMAQYNAQQQKFFCLQELRTQGFVINDNEMISLAQQLQPNELEHVKEFYDILDSQILKLQQDQEQKLQRSSELRKIAFNLIETKIREVYHKKNPDLANQVKIEKYGSMATGLAIDSSDLDLLVHDFVDKNSPRFQHMSRAELIQEMHMLHQALDDVFAIESNTLIDTASVPVIKLTMDLQELRKKHDDGQFVELDEETRILNIDITLDEPKKSDKQLHLGLQCCNYIKSRLDQYPKMKILALVFKKFLSLKNLNKPYLGGLSSYSLVQMILALLKMEEAHLNYNNYLEQMKMSNAQISDLSVGMIFKHFVHQYGYEFNAQMQGIDSNGMIQEKETFNYFLHSPTCNINCPIQIPQTLESPIGDIDDTCTCGFDRMLVETEEKDNDKAMYNMLAQLLQVKTNDKFNANDPAKLQERRRAHAHANAAHLIIVDPLNKLNNIGKSSFNFAKIQQELKQIYERLNDELIRFCRLLAAKIKEESAETEEDMIDGLIPRILDIDYKIQQVEEQEEMKSSEKEKGLPAVSVASTTNNTSVSEETQQVKKPVAGKKSGKKKAATGQPQAVKKDLKKKK